MGRIVVEARETRDPPHGRLYRRYHRLADGVLQKLDRLPAREWLKKHP
jgi:hypothetical protein